MKPLILLFIMSGCLSVYSEKTGDFAPLLPGNVWKYIFVEYGAAATGTSVFDSTLITITLHESTQKDDTLYHNFKISRFIRHYTGSTKIKASVMIGNSTSSNEYSLIDINNTIKKAQSWPCFTPALSRYYIDSDETALPLENIPVFTVQWVKNHTSTG